MKKSTIIIIAILGGILLLGGCACGKYNSMVTGNQNVSKAWSNVETNYQRRTDLYNSVLKTVEASANFEKGTLKEVIEARAKATSINVDINDPKTLEAFQQAQGQLQGSFSRLIASFEAYPDLKTTKAFQDFQVQIEGTENRINTARRDYNEQVEKFNILVKTFPNNMYAGMFGFTEKAFYKANPGSENPPELDFNIK